MKYYVIHAFGSGMQTLCRVIFARNYTPKAL